MDSISTTEKDFALPGRVFRQKYSRVQLYGFVVNKVVLIATTINKPDLLRERAVSENNDVTLWIKQVVEQPSAAMHQIWNQYFEKLVTHARRKLRETPRRVADEEDIALSAMNSFFNGVKAGRFPKLEDRHDLWKILLTITARKANKRIRHNTAQKRGGGAVRGESVFAAYNTRGGLGEIPAVGLSTQFMDEFTIECSELLAMLNDELLQQIAVRRLEGYSTEEIAVELNCAVRTVERKIKRIRAIWGDAEN